LVRSLPNIGCNFLPPEENELVDQLSELIIPTDDHSPGAQAAKVSLFADLMLATGDEPAKQQWRNGLRLIRQEAEQSSLPEALAKAAVNEADPKTEVEHFFVALKEMILSGYYTSFIGIIRTRSDLPMYTLKGYKVRGVFFGDGNIPIEEQEAEIAKLAPDAEMTFELAFATSEVPSHVQIDVLRPTSFSAYSLDWKP
jgi:hypothetical protein